MLRSSFSIRGTSRLARDLPFSAMKERVLGRSYDLSVALVSPVEARRITRATKGKDKASNVLAFPLSRHSGEIILCPATAKKEARLFNMPERDFLGYLFIHGLLHIKGYRHGATMERAEERLLKHFKLCKELSPGLMSAHTKLR